MTLRVAVPVLPAASRAVIVRTFVPLCRTIPLAVQLVVPVAVPLPPRLFAHVTWVTPMLSAAVPATVSGLVFVVQVGPAGRPGGRPRRRAGAPGAVDPRDLRHSDVVGHSTAERQRTDICSEGRARGGRSDADGGRRGVNAPGEARWRRIGVPRRVRRPHLEGVAAGGQRAVALRTRTRDKGAVVQAAGKGAPSSRRRDAGHGAG